MKNPLGKLERISLRKAWIHESGDFTPWLSQADNLTVAFPQTCRHFSLRSLTLPLELMGAELIEMLVASNSIVETLDVIEDF